MKIETNIKNLKIVYHTYEQVVGYAIFINEIKYDLDYNCYEGLFNIYVEKKKNSYKTFNEALLSLIEKVQTIQTENLDKIKEMVRQLKSNKE